MTLGQERTRKGGTLDGRAAGVTGAIMAGSKHVLSHRYECKYTCLSGKIDGLLAHGCRREHRAVPSVPS